MDILSYTLGKKSGGGSTPTGTIDITSNGTVNVTNYATANVNVQPDLETKSVTITENTTTTITPTTGKDGISSVSITTNVNPVDPRWATMGLQPVGVSDYPYSISLGLMQSYDTTKTSWFAGGTKGYFSGGSTSYLHSNFLKYFPLIDASNVTDMHYAFATNYYVETIAQINTSNVTDMSNMFKNCGSLVYIPILNTSNVTNMNGMFSKCNLLSSEALDNILQMCINATSLASENKTLQYLGFLDSTNFPISRFENLPHWQDFLNAGWSYRAET